MAIVVSKHPLDYQAINNQINQAQGDNYTEKFNRVMASMAERNVNFSSGQNNSVYFKTQAAEKDQVVACIVEIDKQ